jgi:cytochrome c peroxidase
MHNPNEKTVVHGVRKAEYAPLFESLFGAGSLKDEESAYRHITEAIAAYERSSEMNPFSSKFDLSLDGMVQLTESEARGLALFTGKARCLNCHALNSVPGVKPLFTNFGYQNTGVPKNPENPYYDLPRSHNPQGKESVDLGLGAVLGDPSKWQVQDTFPAQCRRDPALHAQRSVQNDSRGDRVQQHP